MRPLTNSSLYAAVIKKENNFYECNSETRLIEDIMEYLRNCLIVMLFFINNETNKIFNVPNDFDFNELFDLGDFQPFKFNQNHPFLHLHPELQTEEFILNNDENNIDDQLPDIQSDETDSTFSQDNYKVTDDTDDYSNNEQVRELSQNSNSIVSLPENSNTVNDDSELDNTFLIIFFYKSFFI